MRLPESRSRIQNRGTAGQQRRTKELMKAEFPQKTGEAFLPTSEEISMYLHASEDENPIHQGKAAVVPGFSW